jgi:hypothetical protein
MHSFSLVLAVLLAAAPQLAGQEPVPAVPLQTTSGTGFTGVPYSATETTVTVRTLSDGTQTTQTFVEQLWRDNDGRTRREMIRYDATGREFHSIIITNPVAGVYVKWTAGDSNAQRIAAIWPIAGGLHATSPAQAAPAKSVPASRTSPVPGFQSERLEPQFINGIWSEGTRTTRTIRLEGDAGNRSIQVVNELWLARDLKIIMRHILDDPRVGKTTTDVSDVVLGDPEPALFRPPPDYLVEDHRAQSTP